MSNVAPRYVPYTTGMDSDVSEVTIPFPAPPPPPPPPSSSSAPLTAAPPPRTGFNYRRDPALMMSPLEATPAPATETAAATHATPAAAAASVIASATTAHTAGTNAGADAAPPAAMAVPYIALHNVGWKATNFTGRKWVILPMVAGFESTFIANTLQGLLCLPGCESAMMGDPAPASTTATATDASAAEDGRLGLAKELSSAQLRLTRTGSPTGAAASAASSPAPAAAATEGAYDDLDDATPPEDELGDDDEEPCPDESAALSGDDLSDGGAEDAHRSGGGRGRGGHAMPVLRGGIRCQWGTRVKTAASRTYTSYVMQNLSDAGIQLRKPAPRGGLTVDAAVPFSDVDDAEELESLRGQSAVVPRRLAPVALPTAPKSTAAATARGRGHVAVYLAHPDDTAGPTASGARVGAAGGAQVGGGSSSSSAGPTSAAAVPASSVVAAVNPAASTAASGLANSASPGSTTTTTAAAAALQDIQKAAAVQLVTSEGHSSDDDNNSPTPSSREEEEEEEEEAAAWVSADAAERATAATSAAAARVAHRPVATDASRYTCLASNCVDNMPNYPLPQLQSEDLVDLASFMVARSTLQPDEAVDLQLGTHVLGDPRAVQQLPAEQRAALMQRAARLMEAAVFLQV